MEKFPTFLGNFHANLPRGSGTRVTMVAALALHLKVKVNLKMMKGGY